MPQMSDTSSPEINIDNEHKCSPEEVLTFLNSSYEGLSLQEVELRQSIYGPNEIEKQATKSILDVFVDQFRDLMVIILLFAMALSIRKPLNTETDSINRPTYLFIFCNMMKPLVRKVIY